MREATHVLLVDDSEMFRTRMRRLLEEHPGLSLSEAADAFEGLLAIERTRPDVLLLDLHMPGLDGVTMLHEVRARFGDLRVIVLTANATPGARTRCEQLGADAIIDKADAAVAVVPAIQRAAGTVPQEDR